MPSNNMPAAATSALWSARFADLDRASQDTGMLVHADLITRSRQAQSDPGKTGTKRLPDTSQWIEQDRQLRKARLGHLVHFIASHH